MDPGRAAFLLVAFATHGAVGYALVAAFTAADPRLGAVLGIAPDADFLLPATWGPLFVHRGFTHAPAFALAAVVAAYALRRRPTDAAAVGLAVGAHLALDALSPMGLPLLLFEESLPSPGVSVHGPVVTALCWAFVGGLLLVRGGRGETEESTTASG